MQDINYDKVLKGSVFRVTLKGVTYEIEEPPLERVLAFERELAKIKQASESEEMGLVKVATQIKHIIRTIYTEVPEKVLDTYTSKALYILLADVTKVVQESMLPEITKELLPEEKETQVKKKLTTQS